MKTLYVMTLYNEFQQPVGTPVVFVLYVFITLCNKVYFPIKHFLVYEYF